MSLPTDWTNEYETGQRWHKEGGNFHSLSWMVHVVNYLMNSAIGPALAQLTRWKQTDQGIHFKPLTIHDHGCGEGDGTIYLKAIYPFATIKGFDFWPGAIDRAKERWTELDVDWAVADVTDPQEECNIMFCLQTMDHVPVDKIAEAVIKCCNHTKMFVMAWAELPHRKEHPSQDLSWLDDLSTCCQPTLYERVPKPRIVKDMGSVLVDIMQVYTWLRK
jgi:hypothetical protein